MSMSLTGSSTLRNLAASLFSVVLLTTLCAGQTEITGLSVEQATVGTQIDIEGTGFGVKPPRVWFAGDDGKRVKGTRLKVLKPISDELVSVVVKRAVEGSFSVWVDPVGKGLPTAQSPLAVGVEGPSIDSVGEDAVGPAKTEVSITVSDIAPGGFKVFLAGKKAKIVAVGTAGGGASEITFLIPSSVPDGTWDVRFEDSVGADIAHGAVRVTGSKKKLGPDALVAEIDGFKKLKLNGKKMTVDTSLMGPTVVEGSTGKSSFRQFFLEFPFVLGTDQAPQTYGGDDATITYIETSAGATTVELLSDESVTIQISAVQGSRVSGSFSGSLFPVLEGAGSFPVSGTFIYDGSYDLLPSGGMTSTSVTPGEPGPGIAIQVFGVAGATGPTGNFQAGDRPRVTFRMAKDDGSAWTLDEMYRARAMISGPTFNYQRVIPQVSDVQQTSVDNGDGTYTYSFPPLPKTYVAPYNDTDSFDEDDGELTGQDLLDGTYTLALWMEWRYTVNGASFRDVGTITKDFLLGASVTGIHSRAVVTTQNCNQCHGELQFHGTGRRTNELCVMCHTAGAEDRNVATAAGGTPGATIEMSVMIHKIHNGAHLPSVNGVSTFGPISNPLSGMRDYEAEVQPYQLVGFGDSVHDYSELEFPAWPNLTQRMPRDVGYGDLDDPQQDQEDAMLGGVTSCVLCHGDPDDDGPLEAPQDGDLAYQQLRRNTCGSCHDDVVWEFEYKANQGNMPPQDNDATCSQCHPESGNPIAVRDAHLHPLLDETFAEGVVIDVTSVVAAGADPGATLSAGDKLAITMYVRDGQNAEIDASALDFVNVFVSGPSSNSNILLGQKTIPGDLLSGAQPYTVTPPMTEYLERLGAATAGDDEFTTVYAPLWDDLGSTTDVFERTATAGGDTLLAADVVTPVNYIDVVDVTGFDRNNLIVIDDGGGNEEYLKIQTVIEEDNRLWFSSPQTSGYAVGPRADHLAGSITVREVTLTELELGVDYSLDAESGTITELAGAWGDGNAIVTTYTTDFVLPETYPLALNAGPDLGERQGGWAGKTLVDGTYSVAAWARNTLTFTQSSMEDTTYRDLAEGVRADFLLGAATELEPYDLISSEYNCNSCHAETMSFHGNNRGGYQSCIACHGTAASGDRPRYVAKNAPDTDGVTVNFREMIHKIHRGANLDAGDDYVVVGFGQGYPDNFSEHTYDHVVFPRMPSGTQDCATCHGSGNTAWMEPGVRSHPTEAVLATQEWALVCGACHDSSPATAHIQSQSSPITGAESCLVCHGAGKSGAVDLVHRVR
jgi:OmcA/MtrC family decaheme c-type cytochrome